MTLTIKPKTKREEKVVKAFLKSLDIAFSKVEEEQAPYITRKTKSTGKKELLNDLERSVEFVQKYKKGKVKAKSLKQLLNEL